MKTLAKAISALYISAVLGSIPVFAQQSPGYTDSDTTAGASMEIAERASQEGERHHLGWHHGPQLTDDQLQKLSDIRENLREKTAAQRNQMHTLKHQLHKLLAENTVDKGQALSLQAKINALHDEVASARLSSHIDALGVFTPEQRAEMRHMRLARQAFGGRHHHHGGGGRGCGGGGEHHGGWQHHGGDEHHDGGEHHDGQGE